MEDAEGLTVASSSRTVSLMVLRKAFTSGLGKVPAAADRFASEADASEEPSSDIDNNSTHSAQVRIIIIARQTL